MLRLLFIFFFCVTAFGILAQKTQITVFDEEGEVLPFVAVMDEEGSVLAYSDDDGQVRFHVDCKKSYILNYFGYDDYSLSLDCHTSNTIDVSMQPEVISLKTINVVGMSAMDQVSKPYEIATIDKKQLRQFQSQTTVEALEQNGGAYIQRSQMGGGSPILRGFEANKVLLVIDGIRMNNAIYRSGHLQNAISVDQAALENITTLYGPGSILYGSDALGGVIHFQTLRPKFSPRSKPIISGGSYVRYASANDERSIHTHLSAAGKSLASMTSISFSKYGDLRSGKNHPKAFPEFGKRLFYVDPDSDLIITNKDSEKQIFTGYDQTDILQKVTYKFDEKKFIGINIQYSFTSDIPRYDELTIVDGNGVPEVSEWYYGPQKRLLAGVRYDSETPTVFFDRLQIQTAFQHLNEDRHNRAYLSSDLVSNFETVDVYSANVDFLKSIGSGDSQQLSYGLEYRANRVHSTAQRLNKETQIVSRDVFTRYPSDHSHMTDMGVYGLYQLKKERFTAQIGGRLSSNKIMVQYDRDDFFDWPEYFYSGISQTNTSLTWLAGINYELSEKTHVRFFTGTAYRSPNVDDFAKVRVKTSSSISIPNTELSPEKTWNIELGLQHTVKGMNSKYPRADFGITGFYTKISDAIIRQNFTLPNGDSTYLYNGNELRVQANVNADDGYITGVSFQTRSAINQNLVFDGSISWQRGRSTRGGETAPLAHIPPLYGQASIQYQKGKWSSSVKSIFNGNKSLSDYAPGSSDSEEFATSEGSLAWVVFNFYTAYDITQKLQIKLGVENISDLHYRTFSSGLSAPGRNFKIGIYGQF